MLHLRNVGFLRWLKRPELPIFRADLSMGRQSDDLLFSGGSGLDPPSNGGQLRGGELFAAFRWHLALSHQVDQQAAAGITDDNRRAALASLQHGRQRAEIQLRFLHRRAMTFVTFLREHWQDIFLERRRWRPLCITNRQSHVEPRSVSVMRCAGSVGDRIDDEVDVVSGLYRLIFDVEFTDLAWAAEVGISRNQWGGLETKLLLRSRAALDIPLDLRVHAAAVLCVLEHALDFQHARHRTAPADHHGMFRPWGDEHVAGLELQSHVVLGSHLSQQRGQPLPREIRPTIERRIKELVALFRQRNVLAIPQPLARFNGTIHPGRSQEMPCGLIIAIDIGIRPIRLAKKLLADVPTQLAGTGLFRDCEAGESQPEQGYEQRKSLHWLSVTKHVVSLFWAVG